VAVADELSPGDAPSPSESSPEMAWAFPDPGLATEPGPAAEPVGKAPGELEAVPPEFAAAAFCALEIATAASVAPSAAEGVPPGVLAAEGGEAGGGAADAAAAVAAAVAVAAAAAAVAVAAVVVAGGEELPDAGNCPPVDPPSEALFAAALRVGFGAS
jgi:hypothetical protein